MSPTTHTKPPPVCSRRPTWQCYSLSWPSPEDGLTCQRWYQGAPGMTEAWRNVVGGPLLLKTTNQFLSGVEPSARPQTLVEWRRCFWRDLSAVLHMFSHQTVSVMSSSQNRIGRHVSSFPTLSILESPNYIPNVLPWWRMCAKLLIWWAPSYCCITRCIPAGCPLLRTQNTTHMNRVQTIYAHTGPGHHHAAILLIAKK